ncbi:MAG: exo-alpha-sialidase [Planctomycetaceae bacterium]|nr:exo-alpha-sialidase [Planctomycetaceae bacterium]
MLTDRVLNAEWHWVAAPMRLLRVVACIAFSLVMAQPPELCAAEPYPVPALVLDGVLVDPATLDYSQLPVIRGEHAIVSAGDEAWKFRLHNYLIHHDGKYWCMWSHGPIVEDYPTQHVRYSVSDDGLRWSEPRMLTDMPTAGYAYIARDFWLRDGELLGLVARYKGHGAFGVNKELTLEAFAWDESADAWKHRGRVFDDAINNFAPEKLASGRWMTTRRDSRFNTTMLIGGTAKLDAWDVVPVVPNKNPDTKLKPDEPIWYQRADKTCVAVFRDNGGSGRFFGATSADEGRTWTQPEITNFPNATSKVYSLKLSDGRRVLINNANVKVARRELHIAFSEDDGRTYTQLARLEIPLINKRAATFQYPHAIERDGHLLIAFSRLKTSIEVLKIPLANLDQ